jgi:hypothetical protein
MVHGRGFQIILLRAIMLSGFKLGIIHTVHVFKSIYYPTNTLRDTIHMTHINHTRFGIEAPFSGRYYKKRRTNKPASVCTRILHILINHTVALVLHSVWQIGFYTF